MGHAADFPIFHRTGAGTRLSGYLPSFQGSASPVLCVVLVGLFLHYIGCMLVHRLLCEGQKDLPQQREVCKAGTQKLCVHLDFGLLDARERHLVHYIQCYPQGPLYLLGPRHVRPI